MSELNYRRLLEAVSIKTARNGIAEASTCALDQVMKYPHPSRELAFVGWALQIDKLKQNPTNTSQSVEATGQLSSF